MAPKKDIVDELINAIPLVHNDPHSQIIYQYGYLIGLLKSICKDDFYAHKLIERKIKQITGKDL